MKIISFITTIYNVEYKFLDDLFNSFSGFIDDPRIEFIVVDDASNKFDTFNLLKKKFSKNNNFKFASMPTNTKRTGAFSKGISISKGKFISSLDSDDGVDHFAIESLLTILSTINNDFILLDNYVYNYISFQTSIEKLYSGTNNKPIDDDNFLFTSWTTFTAFNTMVNGELARSIEYKEDIIKAPHDDAYFTQEWLSHSKNSLYLSEPFFIYTKNQPWVTFSGPKSMTTKKAVENHWILTKEIVKLYNPKNSLLALNVMSIISSHFLLIQNNGYFSKILFYFKIKALLPKTIKKSLFYKKSWFKNEAKSGLTFKTKRI